MKNRFSNISVIPHNCFYCELRHKMCSYDLPELNEECEHFELGGCFTCKHGGCNGPIEENAVPGGICQSVLAFDFEKCKNYIQDDLVTIQRVKEALDEAPTIIEAESEDNM